MEYWDINNYEHWTISPCQIDQMRIAHSNLITFVHYYDHLVGWSMPIDECTNTSAFANSFKKKHHTDYQPAQLELQNQPFQLHYQSHVCYLLLLLVIYVNCIFWSIIIGNGENINCFSCNLLMLGWNRAPLICNIGQQESGLLSFRHIITNVYQCTAHFFSHAENHTNYSNTSKKSHSKTQLHPESIRLGFHNPAIVVQRARFMSAHIKLRHTISFCKRIW